MNNFLNTRCARQLRVLFESGKTVRLLFVCHGNICRSPMAEYVMRYVADYAHVGNRFFVDSAATSREEIGNGTHPGTIRVLRTAGIPVGSHRARQLTAGDYDDFDVIVGMDSANMRNISYITGADDAHKCILLRAAAGQSGDVADPWYTDNFEETFADVMAGCCGLLRACYADAVIPQQ